MIMERMESPTVFAVIYDPENPFDMAQSIYDNFVKHQGHSQDLIKDIINEMDDIDGLSDFGKQVLQALEFMMNWVATNKGISGKYFREYLKYHEWLKKHKLPSSKAEKNIKKMKQNNNY